MSTVPAPPLSAPVSDAELAKLREALLKATAGPWEADSEDSEGSYGVGDDTHEGFKTYAVFDASGRRLFGCENADSSVGSVEVEYDEDGAVAWDETARQNMTLAALARTHLPALLAEITASRASAARAAAPLTGLPSEEELIRVMRQHIDAREDGGFFWVEGIPAAARAIQTLQEKARLPEVPPLASGAGSFQDRVQPWMMACFGAEVSADKLERNDRFIEEALELVQASGYEKWRAHALVEYVYGRDQGDINQEVGGVMVTLAAHCLAHGVDMHAAAETELARIWTKVEKIRAKQAAKPKHSPLPEHAPPAQPGERTAPPEMSASEMRERAAQYLDGIAGPGALIGEDLTRFVRGLAVAVRALPVGAPPRSPVLREGRKVGDEARQLVWWLSEIEKRDTELAALRAQITALTAERDEARAQCLRVGFAGTPAECIVYLSDAFDAARNREAEEAVRLTAAEARARELAAALRWHHRWHLESGELGLPDGDGGWIGIDNAAEYSDSKMCEQTIAALEAARALSNDAPAEAEWTGSDYLEKDA